MEHTMDWWRRLPSIFLALSLLFSVASAVSRTSFCKCICFSESMLIPLDGDSESATHKKGRKSCSDCNKQFCLDYDIPICEKAGLEDVTTTCFQRDSAKDQAFVLIFIIATVGLLVYAALRPWLQKTIDNVRERRTYASLSNQT